MIIEVHPQFKNERIYSSENAYNVILKAFETMDDIDRAKESFFVLGLTRNRHIKYLDLASVGILSGTLVHAREVFRRAIAHSSDSIVIAHNHPSGNMTASSADDKITASIKESGKIIGIEVIDHIIFSETEYYSYADNGRL